MKAKILLVSLLILAVLVSSGCVSTNMEDYKKKTGTLEIVSVTQDDMYGLVKLTAEFTTDASGVCLMSVNGDRSKGGRRVIQYSYEKKFEISTENPLPIEDVYNIGICCDDVCGGTTIELDKSIFGNLSFCDRADVLIQGSLYKKEMKELGLRVINYGNVTLEGFELFVTYPEGKQIYNSVEVYYSDEKYRPMNLDSLVLEPRKPIYFKVSANENMERVTLVSSQCNNSLDFLEKWHIEGLG